MPHLFLAIEISFFTLFPLVNPIGAIPVFSTLTSKGTPEYRKLMVKKTTINVVIILISFLLIGNLLLNFFGISIGVLKIAGGLIVAHTAWEMVTSKHKLSSQEDSEAAGKEDISFTPMALPMLSGPGSIGAVIALSNEYSHIDYYAGMIIGILLLGVVVFICLALSTKLFKLLGNTGVGVLNRIMGFFILAIAVQLIVNGITSLIQNT